MPPLSTAADYTVCSLQSVWLVLCFDEDLFDWNLNLNKLSDAIHVYTLDALIYFYKCSNMSSSTIPTKRSCFRKASQHTMWSNIFRSTQYVSSCFYYKTYFSWENGLKIHCVAKITQRKTLKVSRSKDLVVINWGIFNG